MSQNRKTRRHLSEARCTLWNMKAFYRKRTSGLNLNTEIVLFNLVYLNNARAICYDGENIIYNSFSWNHVFVINKYLVLTIRGVLCFKLFA